MISKERLRLDRTKQRHSLSGFSSLSEAKPYRTVRRRSRKCFVYLVVLLFVFSLACNQGARRNGMPAGAQAVLEAAIADIDTGRYEKLYNEAADEWRKAATLDESKATFRMLHDRLGNVHTRELQSASEEQTSTAPIPGHSLVVAYRTSFEHADGMETLTLVERDKRWFLARYYVTSTVLK